VNLGSIHGINQSALELLEAAGFSSAESLARVSADDLWHELKRANSILHIAEQDPEWASVENWISQARAIMPPDEPSTANNGSSDKAEVTPVDYEHSAPYSGMLPSAPCALPIPGRLLAEMQLAVADIPSGVLLSQYVGEIDIRTGPRLPGSMLTKPKPNLAIGDYIRMASAGTQRQEIDSSKLRATSDPATTETAEATSNDIPSAEGGAPQRSRVRKTKGTKQAGSTGHSRGVAHSHPVTVYTGALITTLLLMLIPLAIVSSLLLLLSGESPDRFGWVPAWVIVFPLLIPVFGILYLFFAFGVNCRICGQAFFRHRQHRKHPKAHHVIGFGYIFPLCLRILFYLRFRCTHCGTVISLKK